MGVPAFYRWLSERYPKIIQDCSEAEEQWIEGEEVPVDTSRPNPNGMEFDNLYLDMNNIIHPCFHPEDRPAPTTETEVFQNMFEYMDRLFAIVRPRKLLYMAIDGVAPRAKMNQQRSRRFRAAKDRVEAAAEEARLREDFEKQGIRLPSKPEDTGKQWDSNTITPGTPFMHRVSVALQYYIHLRINTDPGWRNIAVILSDSNSPGEGEHKIMSYVREMRGRPGWCPSTRHCLYGLDADLIMLGLATHEPHFVILREVVTLPNRNDHQQQQRPQMSTRNDDSTLTPAAKPQVAKKPYQFLLVSVLRDYLALEFEPARPLPFKYDPERIIDDFVFMCFFVGNDFLPHMPTLEIREGAIETLMAVYRQEQANLGGYLTNGSKVALDKVEYFIQTVGRFEDAIFAKRARLLASQRARRQQDKDRENSRKAGNPNGGRGYNRRNSTHVPSEEYRNSLFEIGNRGKGPGVEAELNFRQPLSMAESQPALLPPPPQQQQQQVSVPGLIANGDPGIDGSNQSAAAALRERMRSGKRVSVDAEEDEKVTKKVKLEEEGASTLGQPPDQTQKPSKTLDVKAELDAPSIEDSAGASVKEDAEGDVKEGTEANGIKQEIAAADEDDKATVDTEADRRMREEEMEAEEELTAQLAAASAEHAAAAERLKTELAEMMKQKGDAFDSMIESEEKIRLGEEGWKARYYQEKTGLQGEAQAKVAREMVAAYVEGLCWVMAYYYDGVASWTWFYPFHYAPFASDLKDLQQLQPTFTLGEPFKPFNQLMGVLPAGSAHALPKPYQSLFSDVNSPILDFYPHDFAIDMNGKRFAWQGVALLPFIDESRLLAAVAPCEEQLTEEEHFRNARRAEQLYLASWHPLAPDIFSMASDHEALPKADRPSVSIPVDPQAMGGTNGELLLVADANPCPPVIPAPYDLGDDLTSNAVVAAGYRLPPHQHHMPRLLPGHKEEPRQIQHADLPPPKPLWHEDTRRRQGFHAEREARMQLGTGHARAPLGPPTQLAPGGFNMVHAALGQSHSIGNLAPRLGPQVPSYQQQLPTHQPQYINSTGLPYMQTAPEQQQYYPQQQQPQLQTAYVQQQQPPPYVGAGGPSRFGSASVVQQQSFGRGGGGGRFGAAPLGYQQYSSALSPPQLPPQPLYTSQYPGGVQSQQLISSTVSYQQSQPMQQQQQCTQMLQQQQFAQPLQQRQQQQYTQPALNQGTSYLAANPFAPLMRQRPQALQPPQQTQQAWPGPSTGRGGARGRRDPRMR